jgi:hypothetical protein
VTPRARRGPPGAQQVVTAGDQVHQIRLGLQRHRDLLGEDLRQQPPTDREVGVLDVVVGSRRGEVLGEPVARPRNSPGRAGSGSLSPSVKESPRAM